MNNRMSWIGLMGIGLLLQWGGSCQAPPTEDHEDPEIVVLSPQTGQTIYDEVEIRAVITDDVGVILVEFLIDGVLRSGLPGTQNRYTCKWNTTNEPDSSNHWILIRAHDNAGNVGVSDTIRCIVNNQGRAPLPVTVATPTDVGKHHVTLSWTPSIDREFATYQVWRNHADTLDNNAKLVVALTDINRNSFQDVGWNADQTWETPWGLAENQLYYYWVVVADTAARRGLSASVSATTKLPTPVILKETYTATKLSAQISWYASSEDVQYYRIHRSRNANMGEQLTDSVGFAESTVTTFRDTGLTVLTSYYYRVFVVDNAGYSAGSNTIRIKTGDIQPVVLQTPLEQDIGKTFIRLKWSRSQEEDPTKYYIYRAQHSGVTKNDELAKVITDPQDTVYLDKSLAQGVKYFYVVYLQDSRGNEIASNEINAATFRLQALPITASEVNKYDARLKWTGYSEPDFACYKLYRGTTAGFDTATAGLKKIIGNQNTAEFHDTGLQRESAYHYQFFIRDTSGYEAQSEVALTTRNVSAVEILSVAPINDQYFRITFTRNRIDDDFHHYAIYRNRFSKIVDQTDTLIATITNRSDTVYNDNFHLQQMQQFYYRVYVFDQRGNSCNGSNIVGDTLNTVPDAVTLSLTGQNYSSISLTWTINQNEDFLRYDLYRAQVANFTATSPAAKRIATISERGLNVYTDGNLPSGVNYYYCIYVVDQGGKSTGSNIVNGYTTP